MNVKQHRNTISELSGALLSEVSRGVFMDFALIKAIKAETTERRRNIRQDILAATGENKHKTIFALNCFLDQLIEISKRCDDAVFIFASESRPQ